jgi:3-hydroxyacyl-CoA dehydrogenase
MTISKIAVLGAGVMGAQIAAHLANAGLPVLLFDLPSNEGPKSRVAIDAISRLLKLSPAPLVDPKRAEYITPCNYETDIARLKDCDLIIEAIAEKLEWKQSLYEKVTTYLSANVIFASNTSGISIHQLSAVFPESVRHHFCGVHFFNPPRYMKLVELIPHDKTDKTILDALETFLVKILGKGVVRAKDTPNFIGNRIGVFSLLAILHHTKAFGLSLDEVDALTGTLIGRPKSASYRTLDVVGLDTMSFVVNVMQKGLSSDPWRHYFELPKFIQDLIAKGYVGQKSEQGIYRKEGKVITVINPETGNYAAPTAEVAPDVKAIFKIKDPKARFQALSESSHKQAQFLWAIFRDVFHYAAYHLESIATTTADIDNAMKWGYGWQQGIFEFWQAAGVKEITALIEKDIKSGKTLASVSLPKWTEADFYHGDKAYAPGKNTYEIGSSLSVYERHLNLSNRKIVYENEGIAAWTLAGYNILIASFKSKANTVNAAVLQGLQEALALAEKSYEGFIIYQMQGEHFSYGADLTVVQAAAKSGDYREVEKLLDEFHATGIALKYARVPTIAVVRGSALGGGCEIVMQCSKAVAFVESYLGLVEAGVGLLPAGGGTKEFALRAAQKALHDDLDAYLADAFATISMAKTSSSAHEAVKLGYLRESDVIVFDADALLYSALHEIQAMNFRGYVAPVATKFLAGGKPAMASRLLVAVNMRDGGFISAHDYTIAAHIAEALCGGKIEAGSLVDEAWLNRLETTHFLALCKMPLTQERIAHTLSTGKPLRN